MEETYRKLLKRSLFYILISISAVFYVLTGLILFKGGQKSFEQIVAEGFTYFIMGVLIHRLFEQQGVINGKSDEAYTSIKAAYSAKIETLTPRLTELDTWCGKENAEALRAERVRLLARAGLTVDDCFADDGTAKEVFFNVEKPEGKLTAGQKQTYRNRKKVARLKNKAFKRARNAKIRELTIFNLTSNIERRSVNAFLSGSLRDYLLLMSAKDTLMKILLTFVFGYFAYEIVQDVSWVHIIYKAVMVLVLIIIGVSKMYAIERYIKEDEVDRINEKLTRLKRFENSFVGGEKE